MVEETGRSHTIAEQSAFYDHRWADHAFANRLKMRRAEAILGELRRLGLWQPRSVDLACGTGWMTAILGEFGPATGLELSPDAVERARLRHPAVHFEATDLTTYRPAETFDLVVSQEVIEHVEDQAAHMAIARDLLDPGGHLILTTPNASTFAALDDAMREQWSHQPIENWIDRARTRELAEEAGLDVLRLTTVIPNFGRGPLRTPANSRLAVGLARRTGFERAYDAAREAAGLGLHILLVARRR